MSDAAPFQGNLHEVDQVKPAPTDPRDVIVRPQRTPSQIGNDIAGNCLGPLKPIIGGPTYRRVHASVRDAVEASIQRERDEAAAAIAKASVAAKPPEVAGDEVDEMIADAQRLARLLGGTFTADSQKIEQLRAKAAARRQP